MRKKLKNQFTIGGLSVAKLFCLKSKVAHQAVLRHRAGEKDSTAPCGISERNQQKAALPAGGRLRGRSIVNKSRCGTSLIEFLVVIFFIILLAVGMGTAISAALSVDQNYREESAVRTALARCMDFSERYISLATVVNTNFGAYAISYPLETGGVAFETNHRYQVVSSELAVTNDVLVYQFVSGDGMFPEQSLSAEGKLRVAPARLVEARIKGEGSVRRLALSASFPVRIWKKGSFSVETNTITVSRPVRLWNKNP